MATHILTICSQCGESAEPTAVYCSHCGASLSATRGLDRRETPGGDGDETRLGLTPLPDADATRISPSPAIPNDRAVPPAVVAHAHGDSAIALVGQPLGARYQIQRLLGTGGMGAVYAAWDKELNVVVALKTVRPEIASDPETARELERRFKQELLLARQVTHKNIVRVHDMGEVNGIKYITMPYLEGQDLASVLKQEGRLSVGRVLRIGRQVASGLAAAHEAGVVHRDLKPANIMLESRGEALIMDFGVARSTETQTVFSVTGTGGLKVARKAGGTGAGLVVGTIEYMAPEQARGESVDHRADIYAFGLILYDLLLGRTRATRTGSAIAELNLRMQEQLPSPRTVDADIPEALDRIINKCIRRELTERYATTAELVADLERLDDKGQPLPVARRFTWRIAAVAATVLLAIVGLTWWLARPPAAPVERDAVSVVIADFQNTTGDSAFDQTLEPMMRLALEGASFVSAYDRNVMLKSLGVRPPDVLDERSATEIAVKQGLGVVVAGTVTQQGTRYTVSMKATQAVTGTVLTNESESASSKDKVLAVATSLAGRVRESLGDDTSGSAQRFAMEKLSATSLEVVREYAAAMEDLSRSRFEEAKQRFAAATKLDPKFGLAYAGLAISSYNLDRREDALRYIKEALTHLDGMTERETLRTRGMYYLLTSDYQNCVKEYGDLIALYKADAAARNNKALCQTYLRDVAPAVAEMQAVVKILPNRALYRQNLALYLSYSGDFSTGEREARTVGDNDFVTLMGLAFAQLGQDQFGPASVTYQRMEKTDALGASYAASGLADIAAFQGRYAEAIAILSKEAADDLGTGDTARAAMKYATIAQMQALRGDEKAAITWADRALQANKSMKVRFVAARALVYAGALAQAREVAREIATDVLTEAQTHARIIEGMAALQEKDAGRAVTILAEANRLRSTWIGQFELGRAYLGAEMYPQASSESVEASATRWILVCSASEGR
jgi:serine/threonine protein kinase/tetratricopeptide (TPR) repeat protein